MRHVETEIKLEVRDPRALKRRLKELGFCRVRARRFERNALFDFADRRLSRSRCLLRLRLVGGTGLVTFKGAPQSARGYKVRREIEAAVGDGDGLRDVFEALGLREVFRYEKYRTDFAERKNVKKSRSPLVLYDETPIGHYLELEGARRSIDRVARALGYHREDYISASYAALYYQTCRDQGKEPANMVFRKY